MYERAQIDGFRGMDDVSVGPFGRVNLVVGPGGTAKTSLLEALFFNANDGRADVLSIGLQQRGIDLSGSALEQRRLFDSYLSSGRRSPTAVIEAAWAGRSRSSKMVPLEPSVVPIAELDPVTGQTRAGAMRPLVTYEATWQEGEAHSVSRLHITVQGRHFEKGEGRFIPSRLHGSRSGRSRDIAPLWSISEDLGESERIVELLRQIDPDIRNVRLGSSEAGSAIIRVNHGRMGSVEEPELLGGWLRATLGHLAGMSKVREGLMLVDEFDGPVHVSALRKIAQYITSAARRLNVQVFLTTHREESVDAFLDLGDHIDEVVVLRAKRREGRFSFEAVPGPEALYLRDEVGVDLRRTG